MIPRFVTPWVRSARLLAVAAASLLCLLLVLQLPVRSQVNFVSPAVLGSISGRVTNAAGDPLPGIQVTLSSPDYPVQATVTSADGRYALRGLAPGSYPVWFFDPTQRYAAQYYGGAVESALATRVMVSGQDITGIDAALAPAATLVGTTDVVAALPSYLLHAQLYRLSANLVWDGVSSVSNLMPSQPYTFTGLAEGIYQLCVLSYSPVYTGQYAECYDDLLLGEGGPPLWEEGQGILLAAGETRRVHTMLADVSQVSGRILGRDDQPVANVVVTAGNDTTGYYALSGEDGHFRFGYIAPGSYWLYFSGASSGHLDEYYPDRQNADDAQLVTVTNASRQVINATLTPAAMLTGTLALEGGGRVNLRLFRFWQAAPDGSWQPIDAYWGPAFDGPCRNSCYESDTGLFSMGRLAAGRYRLSVEYIVNSWTSVEEFYGGATLAEADDFVLAEGEIRSGVQITLGVGLFEGSIGGQVRAGGTLQSGIEAALFDVDYPYFPPQPLVSSVTDAAGRYRFDGLMAGPYWVGMRDPMGRYAPTFYRAQPSIHSATPLTLTNGMALDAVDADLAVGGSIRGTVRRTGSAPVEGYWVVVYLTNAEGTQFDLQPYLEARTDATGCYQLPGLAPGHYYVAVWPPTYPMGYPLAFHPFGSSAQSSAIVVVEAGKIVEGIDVALASVPVRYLPFAAQE